MYATEDFKSSPPANCLIAMPLEWQRINNVYTLLQYGKPPHSFCFHQRKLGLPIETLSHNSAAIDFHKSTKQNVGDGVIGR